MVTGEWVKIYLARITFDLLPEEVARVVHLHSRVSVRVCPERGAVGLFPCKDLVILVVASVASDYGCRGRAMVGQRQGVDGG